MFFNKIKFWLNFFMKVKLKFSYPQKKKILIFDNELSDVNTKILGLKNYEVLHTRKEVYNLPILRDLLLELKFSQLDYYKKFIEKSKAELIITFIDNNFVFYKLKKFFNNKKFIAIQNGHRMAYGDIFGYLRKIKNQDLSADMIFTFNNSIGREYKKRVSSKFRAVGSIKNNFITKKNFNSNKKNVLYISAYRPIMSEILKNKVSLDEYEEKFGKKYPLKYRQQIHFDLPKLLKDYCINYDLKLIILGSTNDADENFFYQNMLKSDFLFKEKKGNFSNYRIIDNHDIIVSTYSTLGYEAIARGKKVCFFSPLLSRYEKSYNFGWPYIKKKNSFFFTSNINYKSVEKTINNLRSINYKEWNRKIKNSKKNLMVYDSNNLKIKKFINKILNT